MPRCVRSARELTPIRSEGDAALRARELAGVGGEMGSPPQASLGDRAACGSYRCCLRYSTDGTANPTPYLAVVLTDRVYSEWCKKAMPFWPAYGQKMLAIMW